MKDDELEARLSRLEARLDRVVTLLEGASGGASGSGANGHGGSIAVARQRAEAALAAVVPAAETEERLASLLVRLGDSEMLETIQRIALLLPDLEYALQGVAAGPALLEEGLELLKSRLAAEGEDDHDLSLKLDAALEAAKSLTQPRVLRVLGELGKRTAELSPVILGAARASRDLAAVEGESSLAGRVSELLVRLADAPTLEALTRIATLAPDIEYAATALAAGPALLEEGIGLAKERLAFEGVAAEDLNRRLEPALQALFTLTQVDSLEAVREIGGLLPHLAPVVAAVGRAGRDLAAVEGHDALAARLSEALIRIASPEVLDSLVRVATLAPDIEYALNAVAAGPALLEEGVELVRARLGGSEADGGVALGARLQTLAGTLQRLAGPSTLASLERGVVVAPPLLGLLEQLAAVAPKLDVKGLLELAGTASRPESLAAIRKLLEAAPTLGRILGAMPSQAKTLEVLSAANHAVAAAATKPESLGRIGLWRALGEPEVRRSAGFAISVAREIGRDLAARS